MALNYLCKNNETDEGTLRMDGASPLSLVSQHAKPMSDYSQDKGEISLYPQSSHISYYRAAELVKEIASLEREVLYLERRLLSRYREAFDHYLQSSLTTSDKRRQRKSQGSEDFHNKKETELQETLRDKCLPPAGHIPYDSPRISSGRFTLREYFCSSPMEDASLSACKLSEEMIVCMSSIYIKLSDQEPPRMPSSASLASLSRNDDVVCGGYEVIKLSIDGHKFNYAETMLSLFKSFILRLEKVDPTKMRHEERLAFWINIHNALVMHAFLAYGLHRNYVKSTRSIMKAAYNVGGSSVNAHVIQRSILGCRPLSREPRLQALFLPSDKFANIHEKHPYALSKSEPLVHFALCVGAYSDPAVRVYSSSNIHNELKLAREEYLQANVFVDKETKILLPQLLRHYARAASMDLPSLMEVVYDSMPESYKKALKRCIIENPKKLVHWQPHRVSFKYILQQETCVYVTKLSSNL